jgi:single-stranded-DNA-specific exonuclease
MNTTDADILSTEAIDRIKDGVSLLIKHLADDKLIYMVVDADCDGFTSSAILLNYLHEIVPTIVENKFYYVFHPDKSHGIILDQLKENTGLVIAADASSNEH